MNTDSMTTFDAESVKTLVRDSGLLELQSTKWKAGGKGADVLNYQIIIEVDGDVREFSMDDISVPEKAIPLFEYLLDHCQ